MLGGGLMGGPLAAISKLQAAGLNMDQIKVLGTETLAYAKEVAGDDLVKQVAGSIPGLAAMSDAMTSSPSCRSPPNSRRPAKAIGASVSRPCSRVPISSRGSRPETADGIAIAPLYASAQQPAKPAGAEQTPWTVMQRADHPDAGKANAQALDDLNHGATGLDADFRRCACSAWLRPRGL